MKFGNVALALHFKPFKPAAFSLTFRGERSPNALKRVIQTLCQTKIEKWRPSCPWFGLNIVLLWEIIIGILYAHQWLQWKFIWCNALTWKQIAIVCITLLYVFSLSIAAACFRQLNYEMNYGRLSIKTSTYVMRCQSHPICFKIFNASVWRWKETVIMQSIFNPLARGFISQLKNKCCSFWQENI